MTEGTAISPQKNFLKGFIIFAALACITIFIFENINGRFLLNDYKVYYLAAKSLVSGDHIYGVAFGLSSGLYKYSPVILLFFIPFSFIPYYVSAVIFYFIIALSVIILFLLLRKILNNHIFLTAPKHENIIYALSFLFVLSQLHRELHLGNTNIILLVLLMLSLQEGLRSKYFFSGTLFGIAVLFKPFFLILILPVILFRKWKILLYAFITVIFLSLVFMMIFGMTKYFQLHHEWIGAMLGHSAGYHSDNTVTGMIQSFIGIVLPGYFQYIIISLFVILYFIFEFLIRKKNIPASGQHFVFGWFMLLAILPNIVNTDTEHFLYALPLITFIILFLFENKNRVLNILFFILFLLHGLNSSDIVGKHFSDVMTDYGFLGISNICIFTMGIILFAKEHRK